MHPALKKIIDIQELDMQMIQLMRLKRERQKELEGISTVKSNLQRQVAVKENEILKLKTESRIGESEIEEINAKFKKLESQQSAIKKVEEFNALSHEMAQVEKERGVKEQRVSDLMDQLATEEETLKQLRSNLATTDESSKILETEIFDSIEKINAEGKILKAQRDEQVGDADPEIFAIYERLLKNKKGRTVSRILLLQSFI